MIAKDTYHFHTMREKDIAVALHVTTATIRNWVKSGCPQNEDRKYNLYNVHTWLLDREVSKYKNIVEKGDLGSQKTAKEIELLNGRIERQTIENEELKKNTVSKYLYNKAINTIIEAFKMFFVDSIKRNIRALRAIEESDLPKAIDELGVQATKHMVQSVKRVESAGN